MIMNTAMFDQKWNQNGSETDKMRLLTVADRQLPTVTATMLIIPQPLLALQSPRAETLPMADCLLIGAADLASIAPRALATIGLPVVVTLPSEPGSADFDALDHADGFLFPDDDVAMQAAVLARAVRGQGRAELRELSPDMAEQINAISAEANRIAEALARLAAEPAPTDEPLIDAGLVRRLIKLRRERDRFIPGELFADPAWDMMLDLAAARLEGKQVPVSSLCIAANVPTTTALRWIRSLADAGLFERSTDPSDARRTWIALSPRAADAMLGWLRAFASQFSARG